MNIQICQSLQHKLSTYRSPVFARTNMIEGWDD